MVKHESQVLFQTTLRGNGLELQSHLRLRPIPAEMKNKQQQKHFNFQTANLLGAFW